MAFLGLDLSTMDHRRIKKWRENKEKSPRRGGILAWVEFQANQV